MFSTSNYTLDFGSSTSEIPGTEHLFWSAALGRACTVEDSQLQESLLSANRILDEARIRRVGLDDALVFDVGARAIWAAQKNRRLDSIAWQTVSAVISYASAQAMAFKAPGPVPDCYGTKPQWLLAQNINSTQTTIPLRPIYSSCKLSLDATPTEVPHTFENGLTCKDCSVTYSGGALSVAGPEFAFDHSLLLFTMTSAPPIPGQTLCRTLLDSHLKQGGT